MPKQLNSLTGHTDSTIHSLGLCTCNLNLRLPSRQAMGSGTSLTVKRFISGRAYMQFNTLAMLVHLNSQYSTGLHPLSWDFKPILCLCLFQYSSCKLTGDQRQICFHHKKDFLGEEKSVMAYHNSQSNVLQIITFLKCFMIKQHTFLLKDFLLGALPQNSTQLKFLTRYDVMNLFSLKILMGSSIFFNRALDQVIAPATRGELRTSGGLS